MESSEVNLVVSIPKGRHPASSPVAAVLVHIVCID